MRLAIMAAAVALSGTSASAQVADRLSRGMEPNAIDRALQTARPAQAGVQAETDRLRAEQAAREAAARRVPPPSSTMVDGPAGVQRLGSGASPASSPPPTPSPAAVPQS
ncbi:hypothetical protein SAMN05428950_10276 [Sphingomonas sp. OV641]|uniref:hypothetical protein n=1 Tax=Sphingomonas sp. OV641 TaxID=1881068 RepID=UPI0008C3FE0E|nr:hypothetical protein [Sphingomonas sp. OV641]SEJ57791.1 hypothetical protein SAMN05428950_10276 [Sphingomonas sp. OV641]